MLRDRAILFLVWGLVFLSQMANASTPYGAARTFISAPDTPPALISNIITRGGHQYVIEIVNQPLHSLISSVKTSSQFANFPVPVVVGESVGHKTFSLYYAGDFAGLISALAGGLRTEGVCLNQTLDVIIFYECKNKDVMPKNQNKDGGALPTPLPAN